MLWSMFILVSFSNKLATTSFQQKFYTEKECTRVSQELVKLYHDKMGGVVAWMCLEAEGEEVYRIKKGK